MKYPLTFYWDKAVREGFGANTWLYCFIFIREKYRDDVGIYQHELMHIKQWAVVSAASVALLAAVAPQFAILGIVPHQALYRFYPRYRLAAEVMAYKEQLKWYKDDRTVKFASFIANHYNLKTTQAEAEELLRK